MGKNKGTTMTYALEDVEVFRSRALDVDLVNKDTKAEEERLTETLRKLDDKAPGVAVSAIVASVFGGAAYGLKLWAADTTPPTLIKIFALVAAVGFGAALVHWAQFFALKRKVNEHRARILHLLRRTENAGYYAIRAAESLADRVEKAEKTKSDASNATRLSAEKGTGR